MADGEQMLVKQPIFRFKKRVMIKIALAAIVMALIAVIAASQKAGGVLQAKTDSQTSPDEINSSSGVSSPNGASTFQSNSSVSTSTTSSNSGAKPNLSVTVNGQPIDVPQNGTHEETVTTPNGSTSVTVQSGQTSNSNNFSVDTTTTNSASFQNYTVMNSDMEVNVSSP